ncbi:MAG: ArsB/NhaD family transporter [Ornithinibacter sp.]
MTGWISRGWPPASARSSGSSSASPWWPSWPAGSGCSRWSPAAPPGWRAARCWCSGCWWCWSPSQYAHDHGLGALLGAAAGTGESWTALLRMAGLAALGANLVDNLPSYLALEPTAQDSPLRLAGLLVGVNAGPLVTPWASLATLLWAARCRSAGVSVSWGRFALRGLLLVPLLLVTAVTALWLAHR